METQKKSHYFLCFRVSTATSSSKWSPDLVVYTAQVQLFDDLKALRSLFLHLNEELVTGSNVKVRKLEDKENEANFC